MSNHRGCILLALIRTRSARANIAGNFSSEMTDYPLRNEMPSSWKDYEGRLWIIEMVESTYPGIRRWELNRRINRKVRK